MGIGSGDGPTWSRLAAWPSRRTGCLSPTALVAGLLAQRPTWPQWPRLACRLSCGATLGTSRPPSGRLRTTPLATGRRSLRRPWTRSPRSWGGVGSSVYGRVMLPGPQIDGEGRAVSFPHPVKAQLPDGPPGAGYDPGHTVGGYRVRGVAWAGVDGSPLAQVNLSKSN